VFKRSELASFLGVFRTSLSHAIKQLREEYVITIDGQVVKILKLESLIAIERESHDY
jgi:biotin operon repressor